MTQVFNTGASVRVVFDASMVIDDTNLGSTTTTLSAAKIMELIGGGPGPTPTPSPADLFANGERGFWLDAGDEATLFRNTAGTIPVGSLRRIVAAMGDKSGNATPVVRSGPTDMIERHFDVDTDVSIIIQSLHPDEPRLVADFTTSMGSDCTIVFANPATVEFRENQTVGSTYTIPKSFSQCLVINRDLTAPEKTFLRSYFTARMIAPIADADIDFWMNPTTGSDSADGLTRATAKQTPAAAFAQLTAGAAGSRLGVLGGTIATSFNTGTANINKTQHVHFLEPVILDLGQTPSSGASATDTGLIMDAGGYNCHFWCDGNLTIRNIGNNGVGTAGGHTYLYDCAMHTAYDVSSAHATGDLTTKRISVWGGVKSAYAHVDTAKTYDEVSTYYCLAAATGGVGGGLHSTGSEFDWQYTRYSIDPNDTSWAQFRWYTQGTSTAAVTRRFYRCRFGQSHQTPATYPAAYDGSISVHYEECYFNGKRTQDVVNATASLNRFTRCFGPRWTVRPRGVTTNVWQLANNVCLSGASDDNFLRIDQYDGTTELGGSGYARNNIVVNCTVGIFANATGVSAINTNWQFQNQLFNGNTTNMTAGLTADGVDVVGNPLLADTSTAEYEDWKVTIGSPALGAGVAGADIGLGLV